MDEKTKKTLKIFDEATKSVKQFPEKPGLMDYVTEAFEPMGNRAELEALRKRQRASEGT